MKTSIPSLDEVIKLIKSNPKVNANQIEELKELAEKLKNIPSGVQKAPSPMMRRRIDLSESDATDRRTLHLRRRK